MNILREAERLVYGKRQIDYGHPAIDWTMIAELWSTIAGADITPQKATLMMIALKLSRECGRHKVDNLVDIAGYSEVCQIIEEALCRK